MIVHKQKCFYLQYLVLFFQDDYKLVLAELGEKEHLDKDTKQGLEEFICDLYGENESSINTVRYKTFRKGLSAPEILPPTQDALYLHFDRANKVAYEWKTALDRHQGPLNPE